MKSFVRVVVSYLVFHLNVFFSGLRGSWEVYGGRSCATRYHLGEWHQLSSAEKNRSTDLESDPVDVSQHKPRRAAQNLEWIAENSRRKADVIFQRQRIKVEEIGGEEKWGNIGKSKTKEKCTKAENFESPHNKRRPGGSQLRNLIRFYMPFIVGLVYYEDDLKTWFSCWLLPCAVVHVAALLTYAAVESDSWLN